MFVRIELRTYDRDGVTIAHARQFTVQRRDDWLPDHTFRETLAANAHVQAWRDYILDRRASADRGVLVYRQMDPRTPTGSAA